MRKTVLLALVGLALLLPAAPAVAGPDDDLARGPDADLAWVERLAQPRGAALLHLRSGKERRIGVPRDPAYSLRLVGPSNLGWLVAQQRQTSVRLYAVGGSGGAREVARAWDRENGTYFLQSFHPYRVLRWTRDRDGGAVGVVLSLTGEALGEVVARLRLPGEVGTALRWDGGGVRIALPGRTCTWVPPEPVDDTEESLTCVDVHSAVVAPKHDLAMVETAEGRYGPTSLRAPATPAWDAAFVPSAISADGTLVAGVAPTPTTRHEDLQVRRVDDGRLLATRRLTHQVGDQVWFEKDRGGLVYLSGVPGRGYVLVRCLVDAAAGGADCARASRYRREWGFAVQGTVLR
ncbi:hypothetical protein GGQ22_19175 [Nocardioides sp. zg-579]|uniref:Uncharacterized protein n=1 Tax=Nocardioides marmotae TaxID=2663857 RepID=A0A6I3JG01_9ACTN|nr:hypothetical protein [Nocardioides marmotae]MCR6033536.1 hypothetical protein [Gordonia jinghuaiqii]MTB97194.1 hypothetical protein [Nocardioides marmotae]QKE02111.1 hypothetical protein HPC71_14295 [Nocardioides marmotae]